MFTSFRRIGKSQLAATFEALRKAARTMFGLNPGPKQKAVLAALAKGHRFPATYPNRAIRRAVQKNKPHRLPEAWKAYLGRNPEFKAAIKRSLA